MRAFRQLASEPRRLVDVLVAAVVGGLSIADVAAASDPPEAWERPADALAYVLVVAASVTFVWRRRAPVAVLGAVVAVVVTMYLREYGAFLSVLGLTALYTVAAHEERRARGWWASAAACAAILGAAWAGPLDRPNGFAWPVLLNMAAFLGAALAAGVVIRNRERIFVDTERRAAEAEADRAAEAHRAAVRERNRIAREMHDVVAHSISVIAVQAAAGREIVGSNPEKAADVFARIEGVGREALEELRRMLGVLRESGDEHGSLAPQPGLDDIPAAVEQSSAAGVATTFTVDGERRPLAPGIELAAYRIVQEALTNVRKHAGAAATAAVRVTYAPSTLAIEVSDDGRGAATSLARTGAGRGLLGIRERVEIYGGELTSGPRPGGGFVVRAVLPIVGETVSAVGRRAVEGDR